MFFASFTAAHAITILNVGGGGTGWGFPGGLQAGTLLTGNGINPISTTTIGSGLALVGGVLSATGGSGGGLGWASTTVPDSNSIYSLQKANVGISSSSPYGLLSVNPNAIGTSPSFVIGSSSATQFVVTTAGNVGIGTLTPAQALTVNGNIITSTNANFIGVVDNSHGAILNRKVSIDDDTFAAVSAVGCPPNTNQWCFNSVNGYDFQVGSAGTGTHVFTATAAGLTGIGTTSPYSLLSVSNSLTTAANTPLFTLASTTGGISTTTVFTVLANGNVGINAIPANLPSGGSGLTIGNSAAIGGSLGFVYSGAVDTSHEFLRNTGSNFLLSANNVYPLWFAGGNTFYQGAGSMNISYTSNTVGLLQLGVGGTANNNATLSLGEIGIGTTTPDSNLTVVATSTNPSLPFAFSIASSTNGTATTTNFSVTAAGVGSIAGLLNLAPVAADILKYGSQAHYFNEASGPSYCFASAQNNVSPTFCMSTRSAASPGLLTVAQGAFGWMSGSSFSENGDTALYRMGAGVVGIGNSYNGGGVVKNANGTLDAGFIGIGTTSPLALLDVTATSTNGIGAPLNLFRIASTTGGTSTTTLLNFNNNGVLQLSKLATAAGTFLAADGSGNIIATTTPSGGGGSGTVTSVATNATLVGGTITTTGTLGLNLTNPNTWTGLQTFANATTTLLSATYASSTAAFFGTLNLPGLTGTQCLQEISGVVSGTGSACGSGAGGSPGGSNGQIQFNDNGSFDAGPLFSLATTTGVVTITMGENILNPEAIIKLGHEGSVTNGYTSIQTQHGVGGSTTFTIPATTGTAVLGTGATSQLAQWTGTNTITNIATSTLYGVAPAGGMVLGWNNSTSAIGWIATSSSSGLSQWVTAGSSISYTAGNVGVGTTTPWAALSVSTTSQQLGTTPLFDVGSTTGLDLFNVMGNGNVGIGTTSPDSIFSINATGGKQILAIATTTSATSLQALLMDQNGNVGIDTIGTGVGLLTVGGRLSLGQQSVSTGVLDFFPSNGGSWFHIDNRTDNTLRISNGVNVGSVDNLIIGTNFVRDPGALSVGATANTSAGTIVADGNFIGALQLVNGTIITKASLAATDPPYSFIGDTGTGMGQFGLGAGSVSIANSGVTTLTTNSSHNFGVGTTTPTTKLSIEAASSTVASTGYAGLVDIISGLENTTLKLFEEIDQWGDLIVSGDAPSLTSCTGGTVNSPSDQRAGSITMGTGLTSCGVLFAHPYPSGSTVHVFLNEDSGTILGFDAQSISTAGFTITAASVATADVVSYTVVATQ